MARTSPRATVTIPNIDTDLLHQQARALAEINAHLRATPGTFTHHAGWIDALEGVENLLSAIAANAALGR